MSAAAACAPTLTLAAPMPRASPQPEARGAAAAAEPKRCDVHLQLWQACAGSLCAVPPVGAAVYYFPQGHVEQTGAAVDLRATRVPPFVPCRVTAVRLMAEPDTDEIYAKMSLVPLRPWEPVADVGDAALTTDGSSGGGAGNDGQPQRQARPLSFAKTLTPSDANNSGGFSVPRFCALSIFPELDYNVDPPVQFVSARDVNGVEWTFRHIYRGTPRRHLLTTGWSNFVGNKKLQAGDSIVFVREEDGKARVGLRRANKRVVCGRGRGGCGNAGSPGAAVAGSSDGKVASEDVIKAARLAAAGQPFEVVHYPCSSALEFCVRASAVKESMQAPWGPGLRFKMAFETEDLSRISWFMGTIAGVEPTDPVLWPHSPWRLLQVKWDEPELLRNVNRVCPWRVELVSNMPTLPRFSAPPLPCKKPRTESQSECRPLFDPAFPPNHPLPLPLPLAPPHPAAPNHDRDRHGFVPCFPFPAVPDSIAAAAASGIQGTRHPQFAPFFSDLHLSDLQQSLLFCGIRPADHQAPPAPMIATDLKIGSPTPDDVKPPGLMLFGHSILTEEQMKSNSSTRSGSSNTSDRSGSGVTDASPAKKNSPSLTLWWSGDSPSSESGLEPGQCKVFVELDAVGRNLDLSVLGSFQDLCTRLSSMFGINKADLRSHMVYRTIAGEVRHVGDEPFSAFVKSAQRITILTDAGSDNTGNWLQ